jgi:hypothetical protein
VASIVLHFETDDYDTWKQRFDSDPAGRRQAATGHSISRGVDNPAAVFVRAEFASVDEAKSFRERLLNSVALGGLDVKIGPTVVERVEDVSY